MLCFVWFVFATTASESATWLFIACLRSFHCKMWIFSLFFIHSPFFTLMAMLWYRIWQSPLKCEAMKTILRSQHPLQNWTREHWRWLHSTPEKKKQTTQKLEKKKIEYRLIARSLYRNNEFGDQFILIQLGVLLWLYVRTVRTWMTRPKPLNVLTKSMLWSEKSKLTAEKNVRFWIFMWWFFSTFVGFCRIGFHELHFNCYLRVYY